MMRKEKDTWGATAVNEISGVFAALVLLPFIGLGFEAPDGFSFYSVPLIAWAAMLVSSLLFIWATYSTYKASQILEAGETRVIYQIITPLTVIYAFFIFSEVPSLIAIFGIILVISGMAVATLCKKISFANSTGIKYAVFGAILYSFTGVFDKFAIPHFPPMLYLLPMFLFPAIAALFFTRKSLFARLEKVGRKHALPIVAIGAFNVLSYIFVLLAFKHMELSLAAPIIGTNIILTVIGGAILLGEKEKWQIKLLGAIMAFAGVVLIGM